MAAWSDLNGKQLSGIVGAYLCVNCPALQQTAAVAGLEGAYGVDANNRFGSISNSILLPKFFETDIGHFNQTILPVESTRVDWKWV